MRFKRANREYELLKGRDVGRDTVDLELTERRDGGSHTFLFGERAEDGEYRFLSLQYLGKAAVESGMLALDLVEDVIR